MDFKRVPYTLISLELGVCVRLPTLLVELLEEKTSRGREKKEITRFLFLRF